MKDLETAIPLFRRARDYHLYDLGGRRYLDLSQDGGRALLGHRPAGVLRDLKQLLGKGLVAELPSVYGRRLEKELPKLVQGEWTCRVFASRRSAFDAASGHLDVPAEDLVLLDPALSSEIEGPAALFRPFIDADYSACDVLFPVLPFPGSFAPAPVLFRASRREPPASDACSPLLLAGLLGSIRVLLKTAESPDIWSEWKLPGWKRRGRYCVPSAGGRRYEDLFALFLEGGVLLPPDPKHPVILPGAFSDGEKKLVERLCAEAAQT